MRDLTRIDRIAGKLRIYWLKHPDLRLGQIVYNMAPEEHCMCHPAECPHRTKDVFDVEDEVIEAALDEESVPRPYAVLSRGTDSWGLVAYCTTEKEAQDMSNSWNRGGSRAWWGPTRSCRRRRDDRGVRHVRGRLPLLRPGPDPGDRLDPMHGGSAGRRTGLTTACPLCRGTGRCTLTVYQDADLILHKVPKNKGATP